MKKRLPKPKKFQPNNATASGLCYTGVAAAFSNPHGEFIVIAADETMLRSAWESMSEATINPEEIKRVTLFKQEDTTLTPTEGE